MAKLIPHSIPSDIDLLPERTVAAALCSQLPAEVTIYHSQPWLRKDRDLDRPGARETLREGESDFVILHPRYGFMVVEVKGGKMFFDPETQRWGRQSATHSVKDPFAQASNNMRALEKGMRERAFAALTQLPFCRCRCVVFPDCDFTGTMPPGADRSMLFGASDLASLGSKIERLFSLQAFVPNAPLPPNVVKGIKDSLISTFRLIPSLWRDLETQEATLLRLTEAQSHLLTFIASHQRAAIKGVAGSGKTMLAMQRAKRFADEGKRVLFLCFTRMLAEWLDQTLPPEYREKLTVKHYHGLCFDWMKKAKLPSMGFEPKAEDYVLKIPRMLEQAIDLLPDRFDAIVVDEAQDFLPAWWDTVELLNAAPMEGPLYVFYDPAQCIYHSAVDMPDLGHHFDLHHNCRNTVAIAKTCGTAIKQPIPTPVGAATGQKPSLVIAASPEAQMQEIERRVKHWIGTDGLKLHQIAVLTAYPLENGPCRGVSKIAGYPATKDVNQWRSGKALMLTSSSKFKGLEADALILADVPEPVPQAGPQGFSPEHLYVACSRAKHLLTICARTDKVRQWLE